MWTNNGKNNFPGRGFSTPPPSWKSRPFRPSKTTPFSERKRSAPNSVNKSNLFHVVHKVPAGDSPYVKAKQVQLIDKDPTKAVSLFWAAINAGDRVDSALKDMAVVMKQLDRSDEAIEAIKSFRHLCPYDSQESIDNVLIELYKRSGRIEEEINMLQCKLRQIEEGTVFGGKRTKAARSQGKKVQITIEQEKSRVLGNLAWAFLQLDNVCVAEDYYRKALSLEADNNKKCNLAICLILTNRLTEAKSLLQTVRASSGGKQMEESYAKSFERASHMLAEKESKSSSNSTGQEEDNSSGSTTHKAQPCVSQLTASTKWTHDDEEMYMNENSRDDHHWDHNCCENKEDICGVGDRDLQNKSSGAVYSSHNYLNCDKWSEGSCIENPLKMNSCIPIEMKGNRNLDGLFRLVGERFNCSTLYSSPTPAKSNVEVPLTQPKNCFWEFNNRHRAKERKQRKGTTGRSNRRKVLFPNPSMNDQSNDNFFSTDASSESEGTETNSNYKTKYRSAAPDAGELEVPFTQPRSCSWGSINGARKAECIDRFPISSSRKLSFEPPTSTENIQELADRSLERSKLSRAVSDEPEDLDADWKQTSCENNSMKIKEEHITVDQKFKHNSSTVGGKKSWADMVEEEEEDGDDEKEDNTEEEEESSSGGCTGDWSISISSSSDEEFNDENLNCNILLQNLGPIYQVEEIKFDSLDLKDGARDSADIVSSRNRAGNSRRETTMGGENVSLARGNRLQVFQEMTVHQELQL
ncbi:uncharacterized protein LOC111010669 isoform X2 [Momordica charantia]|uniref:Uncharacterized protein LOC111010669 isoform X2 n=1 Tax=Momordica charantia TaxID=3673 RepID=A0A6J1CGP2_MOMCH|nr:uncharacterized protein LOC111010669 isoform X2 [Momordica charantia]